MNEASFQILGYSRSLDLDNTSITSSQFFNNSDNPPSSNFLKNHSGKISFVALISIGIIALAIKNTMSQGRSKLLCRLISYSEEARLSTDRYFARW